MTADEIDDLFRLKVKQFRVALDDVSWADALKLRAALTTECVMIEMQRDSPERLTREGFVMTPQEHAVWMIRSGHALRIKRAMRDMVKAHIAATPAAQPPIPGHQVGVWQTLYDIAIDAIGDRDLTDQERSVLSVARVYLHRARLAEPAGSPA